MSQQEIEAFLTEPRKMQLATIGPDGAPHLVTMYYTLVDGRVAFWTYRTSQKARNLDRDPRATCLVEAGDSYDELRGVQISGDVERVEDATRIRSVGEAVFTRYAEAEVTAEVAGYLDAQAAKRRAYVLHPTKVATWDHRKLLGDGGAGER